MSGLESLEAALCAYKTSGFASFLQDVPLACLPHSEIHYPSVCKQKNSCVRPLVPVHERLPWAEQAFQISLTSSNSSLQCHSISTKGEPLEKNLS